MQKLIASYLFQHKTCALPGLGTLSVNSTAAGSDFTNKIFTAPKPVISFTSTESDSDGLLEYIAGSTGVDKYKASEALSLFCAGIKQKTEADQPAQLDLVGSFLPDASGAITFRQHALPEVFFPPVIAERVIHPDAEHQILVGDKETTNTVMTELLAPKSAAKDRWWIWAIVLGAIGLLALLIYFTEFNGLSQFGNVIKI